MLDIVRKWHLKFVPDDSVHTFLERLGELKLAYGVSDENMLKAIPEILRGTVILWFRNNSDLWNSWEEFIVAFKASVRCR
jgi:hypothetical protein